MTTDRTYTIITHPKLTYGQRCVAMLMIDEEMKDGNIRVTLHTLSRELGTPVPSIQKFINGMRDAGLIQYQLQGQGPRSGNIYRFTGDLARERYQ